MQNQGGAGKATEDAETAKQEVTVKVKRADHHLKLENSWKDMAETAQHEQDETTAITKGVAKAREYIARKSTEMRDPVSKKRVKAKKEEKVCPLYLLLN